MEQHITLLGWLHIALNVLLLVIAAFMFFFMVGVGVASGDPDAAVALPIVGTAVGGLMIVLGLPGIITGIGLLKRKPWARIAATVLGILNLTNFPFGTVVGIYTLWILLQTEAGDHFVAAKAA